MEFYYNSLDARCKNVVGAIFERDELKLTVKSSDAIYCRLILRYDGEESVCYDMERRGDCFVIVLSRLKVGLAWYYFEADAKTYGNDGTCVAIEQSIAQPFQLSICKHRKVQGEIKNIVMYQIMPDRFAHAEGFGDSSGKKLRSDWGGMPEYLPNEKGKILNNDFFGGNFEGIRRKLPYLKSLGVTHIYLNPIFKAYSNHRYDTGDYTVLDPLLGTESDFINLIRDTEKQSMCIILDGVFNHTGDDSVYFNKYGNYPSIGAFQSKDSKYYDWYTFDSYPDEYRSWWGIDVLPTINKQSREFEEFIAGDGGVLDKYMRMGVGGFRLDVVDEIPDEFVRKIYSTIKKFGQEKLVIGEVWEDATNKIAYDVRRKYFTERELDGVMNYPLKDAIIDFVINGNASGLVKVVASQIDNYPSFALNRLMNILGTHDTPRIMTVLGKSGVLANRREDMVNEILTQSEYELGKSRLKTASAILFTVYGFPCVYYGDETGMQGNKDPFNRKCFVDTDVDEDLLSHYEKLSFLRSKYSCLYRGITYDVKLHGKVFSFKRRDENGVALIIVNGGDLLVTVDLKEDLIELCRNVKLNKITLNINDYAMFYKSISGEES